MKEAYRMSREEVLAHMKTGEGGLTRDEAERRLQEYGENALQETKRKKGYQVFLEQFADFLVIILIVAAIISLVSGNVESTVVIFTVIILNAVLGTVQYLKAEKSLAALKDLSSPHAKVIRDGVKMEIPTAKVVPGDLLLLEAGDMTAADGRILKGYSLQVNESALTGESAGVEKTDEVISEEAALADRTNMVFAGTLVTYGRADVLVTGTGMNTEIGKIAGLMNETKEKKTPLQVSLDQFSKKLALAILAICALVFFLSMYRKMPVLDSLLFAVALAVAAIPEALGSIVTIVQAMGTGKMAAENAIMKELKAVESLGSVSVICSDKTGTLTQNKMTVEEVYLDGQCLKPEEMNIRIPLHRYLLYNAVLNNDSSNHDGKEIGDPTEYCLLVMARKAGLERASITEEEIRDMMPRMEEIPFDSDRKLMSTKYRLHGIPTILTKGAVDVILNRTTSILTQDGVKDFTEEDRAAILAQNQKFSENGLRVLAFAYREVAEDDILSLDDEDSLTFVGLTAMMDPPREESARAVADAKKAGIKTVMITGDHKVTASAIAAQIGIFEEGDIALTGQELDALSQEELDEKLEKISVYARVSPENKIRIVDAWQRKGKITAMTGDGVNDAPALKKADIGVAMGITGTEVSKDAAAMILADDNFATIIKAVSFGRNVYRNIKNAIQFLLSGNMAGIVVVLYCSLMGLPAPLEPVHLLFINLLTDSLPALAIGMEPVDESVLNDPPRNPKEGIMTKSFLLTLGLYGLLIGAATLSSFYKGMAQSTATAVTMAFATLTLARLFHGFNCRGKAPIWKMGLWSNQWTVGAFLLGTALLALVLFVPVMKRLFLVSSLGAGQVGFVCLMAVLPTVVIQALKALRKE
ncbi:MAG: cation-translocating P-type ATPase [Eubacteriales bacterium]|nr:cation-translocating P-type ATPase [Eubacteriales bacterium]